MAAMLAGPAWAEGEAAEADSGPEAAADSGAEASGPDLKYQTGDVVLPNKVASLHLGSRYRYLDPSNTETMLVAWGNPAGNETQGAIVPTDVDPFGDAGWAVVLTYQKTATSTTRTRPRSTTTTCSRT